MVVQAGKEITTPVTFTNVGKTIAKHVHATMYVEMVPRSAGPDFHCATSGTCSNTYFLTGILFPNNPQHGQARWIAANGTNLTISPEQAQMWDNGGIYHVLFGVVTYDDIFGQQHWTQFCFWHAGMVGAIFQAESCTAYNDADGQ